MRMMYSSPNTTIITNSCPNKTQTIAVSFGGVLMVTAEQFQVITAAVSRDYKYSAANYYAPLMGCFFMKMNVGLTK